MVVLIENAGEVRKFYLSEIESCNFGLFLGGGWMLGALLCCESCSFHPNVQKHFVSHFEIMTVLGEHFNSIYVYILEIIILVNSVVFCFRLTVAKYHQ